MPASILGSIPIMLIIFGSTPAGIDLATFFGSKAAASVLGSSPICARTLGSIPLIMLGSIPAAASILGSMPATKSADLADELGGGGKSLGSIGPMALEVAGIWAELVGVLASIPKDLRSI